MSDQELLNRVSQLKIIFINSTKKVLKREISKNPNTLDKYKTEITENYNNLIQHLATIHALYGKPERELIETQFIYLRSKLAKCYLKLECNLKIPTKIFGTIQLEEIYDLDNSELYSSFVEEDLEISEENRAALVDSNTNNTEEFSLGVFASCIPQLFEDIIYESTNDNSESDLNSNSEIMTDLTQVELIKLCTNAIPAFEGDPLKLESYINAIKLIQPLATTTALQQTFLNFAKTKLSGRALEAIPSTVNTIEAIIQTLREKIRPESSKVP